MRSCYLTIIGIQECNQGPWFFGNIFLNLDQKGIGLMRLKNVINVTQPVAQPTKLVRFSNLVETTPFLPSTSGSYFN